MKIITNVIVFLKWCLYLKKNTNKEKSLYVNKSGQKKNSEETFIKILLEKHTKTQNRSQHQPSMLQSNLLQNSYKSTKTTFLCNRNQIILLQF